MLLNLFLMLLKNKYFLLLIILTFSLQLSGQIIQVAIPSKKISGSKIKPFIDSLKQKILSDTLKFNNNDLLNINGRTQNIKSYSKLITLNMKYNYLLDIVESKSVKQFTSEILESDNIEFIQIVNKENAPNLVGFAAKNGWIIINLKKKSKVDFEVGGLKYRKGRKRKGGDNFLQRKNDDLMIRS